MPLQGGVQGVSAGRAVNASSVAFFSLPTSRNLAGYATWCQPFGRAGARQWTPFLVTFGARRDAREIARWGGRGGMIFAYAQRSAFSSKAFIVSGIDIGQAIVRDSSNRRFALPAGPRSLCPAAAKPEHRAPCSFPSTPISRRTKEIL
jgi:hypothetical protein